MTTASTTQPVHWDLHYDVHLGATWSRFMNSLKEQRILANKCPACDRVFVPPQAYCESCYQRTEDWIELAPEGVLEVFTVAWLGFRGGPKPPYAIGGIRLDGASTLLMHWVVGLDLEDLSAGGAQPLSGSRVRAVWAEERTGQILDIAHFEPCS